MLSSHVQQIKLQLIYNEVQTATNEKIFMIDAQVERHAMRLKITNVDLYNF
jgi:hypothetical protein